MKNYNNQEEEFNAINHDVDMFIDSKEEELPYLDLPTALFTIFVSFTSFLGLVAFVMFLASLFQ
jgi:hypothetical protein